MKHFFHKGPPLDKQNFELIQRGNLMKKKCFIEAPDTNPDILRGGHRKPYQFKNAKKVVGNFFAK